MCYENGQPAKKVNWVELLSEGAMPFFKMFMKVSLSRYMDQVQYTYLDMNIIATLD